MPARGGFVSSLCSPRDRQRFQVQASSAGWSWAALLPCASHEPIHHFAVMSRAARIDASSQILAPDVSPPRPPVLGRTTARLHRRDTILKAPIDIGTEPHLRGKWRQVVVNFSATQGLCIVFFRMPIPLPCCHTTSVPPVVWSCTCAPRVLR